MIICMKKKRYFLKYKLIFNIIKAKTIITSINCDPISDYLNHYSLYYYNN